MSTCAGLETKPDAAKQKPRRQQCCGCCRNHNLEVPVINHHCEYAECTCALCELTRRGRKIMRHQQRLWRYKKVKTGLKDGEEDASEYAVSSNDSFPHEDEQQQQQQQQQQQKQQQSVEVVDADKQTSRRKMVCDKCRNHNIVVKKRGHKGSCPYEECNCTLCGFTFKRQQIMKHKQRVRRSQIAAPTEHTKSTPALSPPNADSPDSDLHPLEDPALTSPPTSRLEETSKDGTDAAKSPAPAASLDAPGEWTGAGKECSRSRDEEPKPQDNPFPPATNRASQPPPLEPLPDYPVTSDLHSPLTFNTSDHNLKSSPRIDGPQNMRLSVSCGCFEQFPQSTATTARVPPLPTYGMDVGHQPFMPWTGGVSGTGERCCVEVIDSNIRPQAPLRPQPIPAIRLPHSQMDWQFLRFPYPASSMLQSFPQPTLSVYDNLRSHHPQARVDEQWNRARGPHATEGTGVHSSFTASLPYFASALLHPSHTGSAKPSFSLMPTPRTLPEYGSPQHGFRQRDQHQVNPRGAFTGSCNNVM